MTPGDGRPWLPAALLLLQVPVTLENLTEDDAGTYWCGIDTSGKPGYFFDRTFQVVLSVTPASTATPSSVRSPSTPGLHRTLPVPTWDTATRQESSTSSQRPGPSLESHPIEDQTTEGEKRSLLGSVHFLLLVLLKVPLFLMMLSAVFWVNRPQWAICGHQSQPDEDNLQPSLPIDILSRDNTTQTRRGRTSGPRPVSSPLIAKNW
ncbi:CMRF35-like molecule 6 isoform X4 [Mustela lutreola]|uniref:CMRF35-like molecule 6 isoform X4 n=1 Tax=Mustela lutreola TaxID=9666 RepID=UPI000344612F|nr:CMRF35-like molecule 6 isoform X4 [Mustela lutreola]